MNHFKTMKIRVNDSNRAAVKAALVAEGYEPVGKMTNLPIYDEADGYYTYSDDYVLCSTQAGSADSHKYFADHKNPEYILTPHGTLMPAADYYRYPETESLKVGSLSSIGLPIGIITAGSIDTKGTKFSVDSIGNVEKTSVNVASSDEIEKSFLEKHLPPGNYVAPMFTTEKTYEPLPIQPTSQWLSDRMSLLAEHISYSLANKLSVDNKLTRELHVLGVMLWEFEEGRDAR